LQGQSRNLYLGLVKEPLRERFNHNNNSLFLGNSMNKQATTILIAAILLCSESLPIVLSQTPSTSSFSAPAIEWQKTYGHPGPYDDTNVESASNLIQTSDGGYVFMALAWTSQSNFNPSTVFKVDSSGSLQWNKTIGFLAASTIIQTSDEGYEIAGHWSTYGTTYEQTPTLIKMDSEGNIQWVANYSSVPDLGVASTGIQTSDGGFVYWTNGATTPFGDGRITKTDFYNSTQWVKNLTYTSILFVGAAPLKLYSVIETSDGALAALAVGYNDRQLSRSGRIYLTKTEAFLPQPSPTALPTPLPTPKPTPTPTPTATPSATTSPVPTVEATIVVVVIVVVVSIAGLLVYFKKRKH
jgi:hypothetical protein